MFIPVAILVGLLQAADSYYLFKKNGEASKFNYFMSTVEFMWVIICVVFIFTSDQAVGLAKLSPIVFISYTATTFIVGTMMMRGVTDVEKIEEIRVPKPFMKLGIGFGLGYALLNLYILSV